MVGALGAALLGAVAAAAPLTAADAHSVVVATIPAARSTVATVPTEVGVTLNEPPLKVGTRFVVTGPEGVASQGDVTIVDATVTQPLRAGLPAGQYTVAWRVTSGDGHPISGKFAFTASGASAPASTPTGSTPTASTPTASTEAPSAGVTAPPSTGTTTPPSARDGSRATPLAWVVGTVLVGAGVALVVLGLRRKRTA